VLNGVESSPSNCVVIVIPSPTPEVPASPTSLSGTTQP
jgi:hypothetical protein